MAAVHTPDPGEVSVCSGADAAIETGDAAMSADTAGAIEADGGGGNPRLWAVIGGLLAAAAAGLAFFAWRYARGRRVS